jgi:hypothetical protein
MKPGLRCEGASNRPISYVFVRRADDGASTCVVVGAGPYGLATAAHLLAAGFRFACSASPWRAGAKHMPEGMLLRSRWQGVAHCEPGPRSDAGSVSTTSTGSIIRSRSRLSASSSTAGGFRSRPYPQLERRRVQARLAVGQTSRSSSRTARSFQPVESSWQAASSHSRGSHPNSRTSGRARLAHCRSLVAGPVRGPSGDRRRRSQSALEFGCSPGRARRADTAPSSEAGRSSGWTRTSKTFPSGCMRRNAIGIGGAKVGWLAARPELFRFLPRSFERCSRSSHHTAPGGCELAPSAAGRRRDEDGSWHRASRPAQRSHRARARRRKQPRADHVLLATWLPRRPHALPIPRPGHPGRAANA